METLLTAMVNGDLTLQDILLLFYFVEASGFNAYFVKLVGGNPLVWIVSEPAERSLTHKFIPVLVCDRKLDL